MTHVYIYIYRETSYTYTIIHNIRLSICIYTWYIQNILIVYVSSPHPIHGDSSNATQDGKLLGQKYGVTTGLIQAIANSRGQRNAWGYLAETGQQWWVNSPAALLAFRKGTCLFGGHVSFYCFFHFFCRDFGYFWTCRGKSRPRLITYLSQSQSRPDSETRQIIFERLHFSFTTKLAEILAVGNIHGNGQTGRNMAAIIPRRSFS